MGDDSCVWKLKEWPVAPAGWLLAVVVDGTARELVVDGRLADTGAAC
jgi:hypothetical protein